jgi:two-component system, NtrC family, response regulator
MARVLIIDDDPAICIALSKKITRMGHDAQTAQTLREGLDKAESQDHDVVFLDVRLPDGNGLDALPRISQGHSAPEVIIITGESDPDGAELAIRSGAWDYIQKPSTLKSMVFPLIRALQYREKKKTSGSLKALNSNGIIGSSPNMKACLNHLAQAASCEMSVLITGETGTGKELFARAIHTNSSRANASFVTVDCAALSEHIVEAELFGAVKGAYTGATASREGMIIQADGGTLFLDEVGELPLHVQKIFLRVLQEHRFRQVGGTKEITSNFRLICATNRNLENMVTEGGFRQDLLYRLQSMQIELPSLRNRPEDIVGLAMHRMTTTCDHYKIPTKGMSPEFIETLRIYKWPGNVRELFNTMDSALLTNHGEAVLYPEHLPINLRVKIKRATLKKNTPGSGIIEQEGPEEFQDDAESLAPDNALVPSDSPSPREHHVSPSQHEQDYQSLQPAASNDDEFPPLRELRERTVSVMEKKYLEELYKRSNADIPLALRLSGLSRTRLYELLKKHSMSFQ